MAIHGLIIAIVAASYWFVEAGRRPDSGNLAFGAPASSPPPPLHRRKTGKPKEEIKPEPTEQVQPTEIPEELPTPEEPQNNSYDTGVEGGEGVSKVVSLVEF
jgi:hypothetical protein